MSVCPKSSKIRVWGGCFYLLFLLLLSRRVWMEVPLWHRGLRIWWCHCSSLGSIPDPRTSPCCGRSQKKAQALLSGVILLLLTWLKSPWKHAPFCCDLRVTWCHHRNPVLCFLLSFQALRLSNLAMREASTGQIVNLLSNDVNRFDQVSCTWGMVSISCPSNGFSLLDTRHQCWVLARIL